MTLRLHYHPLSSFCMKVLVALYEADAPHEKVLVKLGDPEARARFAAVWPGLKFPVLEDVARKAVVAESTIVIEYLDTFYPGHMPFVPKDADAAWRVKMWDRVFDTYVQVQMQKITGDSFLSEGRDPAGVDLARAMIRRGYAMLETQIAGPWFMGEAFTLADCSAAPALFYSHACEPLDRDSTLYAYLGRLMSRPSFARALEEAEPYFDWFPYPSVLSRNVAELGAPRAAA